MVKIASPSIVYSRRRVLQVAFSAGAGGVSATLVGIQTVRAADQKVVRLRFTDNPAYQAQNIIGEYMPKEYKVESIDVGARSMSAFVAMQRGLLDINLAGYTYLVSSYAEGQPIICVAGLAGGAQRVVARRDSGVKTLADVKGKRVATPAGTSTDIKFMAALQAIGINPEKDVQRMEVGGMPAIRTALDSKQADVGVMWEPNGALAMVESPNIVSVDTLSEKAWSSQGGLYVLQSLIDNNRDEVQAIVSSVVKAVDRLKTDREKWIASSQEATGIARNVIEVALTNCEPMYEIPLEDQRIVARWMVKLGLLKRDVSAEIHKAVNYEFLIAATGKTKEQLGYSA